MQKIHYSPPEMFVISNLLMIKIIKLFHFPFLIREPHISLGIISSSIYFTSIFLNVLVCFIIAFRKVLFMNGILLVLAYFCFGGAVSLSAVLQIFRKNLIDKCSGISGTLCLFVAKVFY